MQFTGFLFRHILQNHLVIVYFFSNMSAKNYYHRFLYVEVTARQRSDVLGHSVHVLYCSTCKMRAYFRNMYFYFKYLSAVWLCLSSEM